MTRDEQPLEDRFVQWVLEGVANRACAYGCYPRNGRAYTEKDDLTEAVVRRHFRGETSIGLHAISLDNTCRWCSWDIDAHDEEDRREENWATVESLVESLQALGYEPVIEDSDGRGGFHVWLFFEEPVPAADVHAFVTEMAPDGVEAFPKQARVEPGGFGSWLRLPGKHPRREHWSRVWSGREWIDWPDAAEIFIDPPTSPAPPSAPTPSGADGVERLPISGRKEQAEIAERDEIPAGRRNDALLSLAGTMRRRAMREDEIGAALLVVNRSRCKPPLDEAEVREVAASIMRYDPSDPIQFAVATPESHEQGLAEVNTRLFAGHELVSIRRFVRRGGPGGLLDAELADKTMVPLGTISKVVSFATFKKAIAEATRIVLPHELAKQWDKLLQLILHLVEEEDGENVIDQIEDFLGATYDGDPPLASDDDEALEEFLATRRRPFLRRDGHLYLRLDALLLINKTRGVLTLDQQQLGAWLQRMGWTRSRPGFGRRGEQRRIRLYRAPKGWTP